MKQAFLRQILMTLVFVAGVAVASAQAQYPGFSDPGARTSAGGIGGLVPVEPSVDGGTIPIGATAQVVIRFRNDGGTPVRTGLIRLYPSSTVSANVALNQCEESPLPSGAECAIAFSVKGLQAGPWRLEMLMSHDGRTRLVAATMSGVVEASGDSADQLTSDVESNPKEVDFGSLTASQMLVEPVTLRNITSSAITVKNIYIDSSEAAGYNMRHNCEVLEPGQACIAIVSWSPKLEGRSSGVMVVEHSGPAGLTSVLLEGEYNPEDVDQADVFPQAVPGRGLLVSSQTEVDFGTDIETASSITVSLVNVGDTAVELKNIEISGSDNGLSFKETGCKVGDVLEPIEACPLTVTWSPTRVGALYDDVQVLHDGARGVLVLPIRGAALSAVSQDQKAIVLSGDGKASFSSGGAVSVSAPNPSATLDGYKITSFSGSRAIISGPGGSRIVFDKDEVVLGGVPWTVNIRKSGIEFSFEDRRVLLLFDSSLSSSSTSQSGSTRGSSSSGATSSSSSAAVSASDGG